MAAPVGPQIAIQPVKQDASRQTAEEPAAPGKFDQVLAEKRSETAEKPAQAKPRRGKRAERPVKIAKTKPAKNESVKPQTAPPNPAPVDPALVVQPIVALETPPAIQPALPPDVVPLPANEIAVDSDSNQATIVASVVLPQSEAIETEAEELPQAVVPEPATDPNEPAEAPQRRPIARPVVQRGVIAPIQSQPSTEQAHRDQPDFEQVGQVYDPQLGREAPTSVKVAPPENAPCPIESAPQPQPESEQEFSEKHDSPAPKTKDAPPRLPDAAQFARPAGTFPPGGETIALQPATEPAPAPQPSLPEPPSAPEPVSPREIEFASRNHDRIVTGIRGQLLPRGGSMQIRLDPPSLGQLDVSVRIEDGIMSVAFHTSSDDATRLLSHSLSHLKGVLESQGVSVDRIHVQQTPRDADASRQDADQQQRHSLQDETAARQEQQRKEMLRRMWRRLALGSDPLDMVA